jgi:hypothetical protein
MEKHQIISKSQKVQVSGQTAQRTGRFRKLFALHCKPDHEAPEKTITAEEQQELTDWIELTDANEELFKALQ